MAPDEQTSDSSLHSDVQKQSVERESTRTSLSIRYLNCPICDEKFERNCHGLEEPVECPSCGHVFPYVDGYILMYRPIIEVFIDRVHPLPMVPGHSSGGEVVVPPNEIVLIPFDIIYRKEPEVFFVLPGNKAAREVIIDGLVVMPLSVSTENFILFSRSLDRNTSEPVTIEWMAVGEIGDWEKPLWLNYMQNAAELVRKEEDLAAIVMLLIALDFFYDAILARCGVEYDTIRRVGRRPGMNEKKAKLQLIEEQMGAWPPGVAESLKDLTDYRNKIVHNVVKRDDIPTIRSRRAFTIVLRAIMYLLEMFHRSRAKPLNEAQTEGAG